MDLWNKIRGVVTVRILTADPEGMLNRLIREGVELRDAITTGPAELRMRIGRESCETLRRIAEKQGGEVETLSQSGLMYRAGQWRKRPVFLFTVMFALIMTMYLPERILFVEIQGNEHIPAALIMEQVSDCGLSFGCDAGQVRSEEIKNALLERIDALQWVGVNIYGCRAVVSVSERQEAQTDQSERYCDLIACADGIIESVVMHRGTLLCKPGQAVKKGDVLVSGCMDLGICSRLTQAGGEIFALTARQIECALPEEQTLCLQVQQQKRRIGLIIGKKRINLYSDSGILPPTCGKMTYDYPLTLPGGRQLPAALVIEEIVWYDTVSEQISPGDAQRILEQTAEEYVMNNTISGQLICRQSEVEQLEGCFRLYGSLQFREMIARPWVGPYMEGDTQDDSQNSQRGAG